MGRGMCWAAILAAATALACGSSNGGKDAGTDPGADAVGPQDLPAEVGPDVPVADTPSPDLAADEGTPDTTPADTVEDVPEGPFVPKEEGDFLTVSNGVITLRYDLAHGTFDLGVVPGQDGIVKGRSEALLTVQGAETTIASSDPGPRIEYQVLNAPDELGDAVSIRFDATPTNKVGGVATYINLHHDTPAVTFRTIVAMPFSADVQVHEVRPVATDFASGSTLHLGPGTRDAVLVDNGSEILFDFKADAEVVGENPGRLLGDGLASNWSASLCTAAKSCVVAGFVTTRKGFDLVSTDQQSGKAVKIGGEEGLTLFSLRTRFSPAAGLEAGNTQSSDMAYVDLTTDPHAALLRLGRAIATFNAKPPPAAPPSSWNSWAGGSGSGGQGHDIDETFILQNLDAASRDFLPYGMDYFLVDDGWQVNDGLWLTDATKFPKHGDQDGMKWLADQITAAGFLPGLWIGPFRAGKDWAIVQQHPDWVLPLDDLGTAALGQGGDYVILDPSNPDVKAYLTDVFKRITKDWGYKAIKLDYSAYAMFGATYSVPGRSGLALYREALKTIRSAIGDDTFLMVVNGTGVNYGIADGMRLTLDNQPRWGDPVSPFDQGIKPTVLSAAHRYWMGNTIWSNHPDLLFFRDTQGLTQDEARTFALWVSLFSGYVKLGESFTFMEDHPADLDLVQRMVPPLPAFPEPLDFYTKRWPEVWRVPMADLGVPCEVWGLFHWGLNRDVPNMQDLDESARTLTIPDDSPVAGGDPAAPRAFLDLVDGTVLTDASDHVAQPGPLDVTMAPRTGRLLVARAVAGLSAGPIFLATDRHLMGGGGVLSEQAADGGGTTIAFSKAVPGRVTKLYFLAAAGATLDVAATDAGDVSQQSQSHADADLVTVTLTPSTVGAAVTVRYAAAP